MLTALFFAAAAQAADWPTGNDDAPWTRTASGVEVQDLVVGTGGEIVPGATAVVNYTGMLADGTEFDSSLDRHEPFSFRVGNHDVIAGWEDGALGMRVGGKRRLVIPPTLGYGAQAVGPIPGNSVLYFEIELVEVTPPREPPALVAIDPGSLRRAGNYQVQDVVKGAGPRARNGHRVCVDWSAWQSGQLTEHTYTRTSCTWVRLGEGQLPPMVEAGVVGLKVGGACQVVGPDGTATWTVEVENVGK